MLKCEIARAYGDGETGIADGMHLVCDIGAQVDE
jgi:hypothetical protein